MGASVFGGVNADKIYLNDATLWSGEPVNANMNPEAYKNIPAIREALKNENYKLADSLNRKLQGKFSESYCPLGTLFIDFKQRGTATKYSRELNIGNAISKISYEVKGIKLTREYFISYPDKVMVITKGGKGKTSGADRMKGGSGKGETNRIIVEMEKDQERVTEIINDTKRKLLMV
mgnify:CR=1 FL=1